MKSSSNSGTEPRSQVANARGDDAGHSRRAKGLPPQSPRLAMHRERRHRLVAALMLAAGVSLLLAAGHAIAGALGDPLLGVIATGVLLASAVALIAPMRSAKSGAR